MKNFLPAFGLVLLLPFLALAQEDQPQPDAYCPRLTQDLKRGDCDEGIVSVSCQRHVPNQQVLELQTFLSSYYDDYPDDALTGKFFNTTKSFVKRFQQEQNLPAFGYVGSLTRAAIARVCGTTTPPPTDLSCTFNGQTVQHNHSITAYLKQFVGDEEACQSETRTCTNGVLSGSYQYAWCSHMNPGTASNFTATPTSGTAPLSVMFRASLATALLASEYSVDFGDGASGTMSRDGTACTNADTCGSPAPSIFVPHSYPTAGTSTATLYHNYHVGGPLGPNAHVAVATATITVIAPTTTAPPTVTLTANGQQSVTIAPGAPFTIAWSSSNATSCNLTNAQGQTNSTPPNVSGSSQGAAGAAGTTYTYTLACTNSGGTTTKTATVTSQTTVAGSVGACMYKGVTRAEDSYLENMHLTYGANATSTVLCDNTAWVNASTTNPHVSLGTNVCDSAPPYGNVAQDLADLGCVVHPGTQTLSVIPRHGRSPLTVTAHITYSYYAGQCHDVLSWGDGASEPPTPCFDQAYPIGPVSHTYSTPGSYTIRVAGEKISNSANVRVDSPTASARNQFQLANVFVAVEQLLKTLFGIR